MSARIVINDDTCLNSGQCAYLQPDIFELDDDGKPHVLVDNPTDEQLSRVDDAIAMCPSQSISLVEQ